MSKKVHTTRSRALGVLTVDDTQIVRVVFLHFNLMSFKYHLKINTQSILSVCFS